MKQLDIDCADSTSLGYYNLSFSFPSNLPISSCLVSTENFEKEAKILQQLPRHKNVVRFLCYDLDYAKVGKENIYYVQNDNINET